MSTHLNSTFTSIYFHWYFYSFTKIHCSYTCTCTCACKILSASFWTFLIKNSTEPSPAATEWDLTFDLLNFTFVPELVEVWDRSLSRILSRPSGSGRKQKTLGAFEMTPQLDWMINESRRVQRGWAQKSAKKSDSPFLKLRVDLFFFLHVLDRLGASWHITASCVELKALVYSADLPSKSDYT